MKTNNILSRKPFNNKAIIREEEEGFARDFLQRNRTWEDDEIVSRIHQMSVLEIIS
jgi:hypothetical protein